MSSLPARLDAALARALGAPVGRAQPLSGGMINQAACVEAGGSAIFVKWSEEAAAGHFAAEADGLKRLRAVGALRAPKVLAWSDRDGAHDDSIPYLALEYIEPRRPADSMRFARRFGEELARLHRTAVSPDGCYGLTYDNFIGALPQVNTPCARWPEFYRDCRLRPLIGMARERRLLPPERERLVRRVTESVERLLAELPSRPELLHGDLWSGNLLPAGEEPVVIDPAVYYGEREMEIAYMDLFGGFASESLEAYHASYPLTPGYERRRPLHQLYHLLSHLLHFGEQYGPAVERACRESLT